MNKKIEIINPVENAEWDHFVARQRDRTIFHTSDWCRVLVNTFNYQPAYLVTRNMAGKIDWGMPFMKIDSWLTGKRMVSLPRTSYIYPLPFSDKIPAGLIPFFKEIGADWNLKYIEFLTLSSSNATPAVPLEFEKTAFLHELDLTVGADDLFKSFHNTSVRQRIKRAKRNGITIREGNTKNDLTLFFKLYQLTVKHLQVPGRRQVLFEQIHNSFANSKNLRMFFAYKDNQPIAAVFTLWYNGRIHWEFTGLNYKYIRESAEHLLLWHVLNSGIEEGLHLFDFGITPIENEGLRKFKKAWGKPDEKFVLTCFQGSDRGYKQGANDSENSREKRNGLLNKSKKSVKNIIARRLHKHFG